MRTFLEGIDVAAHLSVTPCEQAGLGDHMTSLHKCGFCASWLLRTSMTLSVAASRRRRLHISRFPASPAPRGSSRKRTLGRPIARAISTLRSCPCYRFGSAFSNFASRRRRPRCARLPPQDSHVAIRAKYESTRAPSTLIDSRRSSLTSQQLPHCKRFLHHVVSPNCVPR